MKYFIPLLIFLIAACETKSVHKHHSPEILEAKVIQSRQVISKRQRLLEDVNLEQKAVFFEDYILKKMHPDHKFAPKLYIEGKPGKLRMDMTALFLSALAFKYAVTENPKDKNNILDILKSIKEADRSNGLDGFIPYQIAIQNDKVVSTRNDTHINVYTQLLFAYIPLLKFAGDDEIQKSVLEHLDLILNHLQKTNFKLTDHEGKAIDYSDLSPSRFTFQSNRQQLLLIFTDLALYFKLGKDIGSLREKLNELDYEDKIQSMHLKIFNLEFPTHSSSWLNLKNSFIGYHIGKAEYYKNAFAKLYEKYKDEKNILFILMWQSMNKDKNELLYVHDRLMEFPLNPTNHEIINSLNSDIEPISDAPYVKLKRELELKSPLPFYQRPMRSFEWKLNQMRVDGNFKSKGELTYTGIDYLIAYWMLRWLQKDMNVQI